MCWPGRVMGLHRSQYNKLLTFISRSIPRLGFRSMCMQDGPVGVRSTDFNSVFPSGQTVAATFDRGLFYERGYAMGIEHKKKGVTVSLGPVAGPLGRAPEGGRNWEGFSPDPCEYSADYDNKRIHGGRI